jgi:hypothetical protein
MSGESGHLETNALPSTKKVIKTLQTSPDRCKRAKAAEELGTRGDLSAVPALIAALDDKNDSVIMQAIRALGALRDPRAAAPLIERCLWRDLLIDLASQALFSIGSASVAPLIAAIEDESRPFNLWARAKGVLCEITHSKAIPELLIALEHPNRNVRYAASKALANAFMWPRDASDLRALGKAMRSLREKDDVGQNRQKELENLAKAYANWMSQIRRRAEHEHKALQPPPRAFRRPPLGRRSALANKKMVVGGACK